MVRIKNYGVRGSDPTQVETTRRVVSRGGLTLMIKALLVIIFFTSAGLAEDFSIENNLIPQPKKIEWGKKAFSLNIDEVGIFSGKEERASTTEKKVVDFFELLGIDEVTSVEEKDLSKYPTLIILGKYEDIKSPFLKKKIPLPKIDWKVMGENKTQGYYLFVKKNDDQLFILLSGGGRAGTFYAFQTLKQLIYKKDDKILIDEVKIVDWPDYRYRGVLEGGGGYWTDQQRIKALSFMADVKLNYFAYEPKGDKKTRREWRRPYTHAELNNFAQAVKVAQEGFVEFGYLINPALSAHFSSEKTFKAIMDKFKSLREVGVRHFGIFFDDIIPYTSNKEDTKRYVSAAHGQADLSSRLYYALKKDNPELMFSFSPTQYMFQTDTGYMRDLRKYLDKGIQAGWTGPGVCAHRITDEDADKYAKIIGRVPVLGDNWPVHGGGICLGTLRNRSKTLYKHTTAFVSNPAWRRPTATQIPVATIADYTWNSGDYDADRAWRASILRFGGKENYPTLRILCEEFAVAWTKFDTPSKLEKEKEILSKNFDEGKDIKDILKEIRGDYKNIKRVEVILRNNLRSEDFLLEMDEYLKILTDFGKEGVRLTSNLINYLESGKIDKEELKDKVEKILKHQHRK